MCSSGPSLEAELASELARHAPGLRRSIEAKIPGDLRVSLVLTMCCSWFGCRPVSPVRPVRFRSVPDRPVRGLSTWRRISFSG